MRRMKEEEEEAGRGGGGDREDRVRMSTTHLFNHPHTPFQPTHTHAHRARAHPASRRGETKKKN